MLSARQNGTVATTLGIDTPRLSRVNIYLDYKMAKKGENPGTNKNMRTTGGDIGIKYAPKKSGKGLTNPFFIRSDLLLDHGTMIRFSSYEDLHKWGKEDKEIAFLIKYIKELNNIKFFSLLKCMPYIQLKISIDWYAYYSDYVKENKIEESKERYMNIFKQYEPNDVKYYISIGLKEKMKELGYVDSEGNIIEE